MDRSIDVGDTLDLSVSSSTSEDSSSESEYNWITWFATMRGNELFCQVDEAYIRDDFNLTGLNAIVPEYRRALNAILDIHCPVDGLAEKTLQTISESAEILYGLIHARFIITPEGMNRMLAKYERNHFGRCPRVYCEGQRVLPVGLSDARLHYPVNLFCPRCQEIYSPRSSSQARIDGAYFGTTFCHYFLLNQPQLIPSKSSETYVPRLFGFRISKQSRYYKGSAIVIQRGIS